MALGWGQWGEWDAKLKTERPIAFFFTETLPDWVQWIPDHTIEYADTLRYKFQNYFGGLHRLDSNLKKGEYHEFAERLLHCSFDSYIDFIEIEEAHSHLCWSDDEDIKKYKVPFWRRMRYLRWGQVWRCPEAGVDHLKWEMTLDEPDPSGQPTSPRQAESAREKMALYTWWKHVRPTRGDAWDASGLRAFWDKMDEKYGDDSDSLGSNWFGFGSKSLMTPAEKKMYDKLSTLKDDLEKQWEQEDDDMLHRLINIRHSLWT